MGNPKQKWTPEEEQALRDGVAKYGAGKWKCIHNDPVFSIVLHSRSNIDLKDKWRNLSAAAQGLSTSRSRAPKPKLTQDAPALPAAPVNIQPPPVTPVVHVVHKPVTNHVKEEPVKDIPDAKNTSRFSDTMAMVFDALSAAKEQNGLDIGAIVSHIEQKVSIESPQTFRKQLGAKLRRLVHQERLEKVENCYRLKDSSLVEPSASNRKDIRPKQPLIPAHLKMKGSLELLEDTAKTAAYKVAEAEEMTHLADVSVREAERLSKVLEENDAKLQLFQELYDKLHNSEVILA